MQKIFVKNFYKPYYSSMKLQQRYKAITPMQNTEYDDIDDTNSFTFTPQTPLSRAGIMSKSASNKLAFQDSEFLSDLGMPLPDITQMEKNEALDIFLSQQSSPLIPTTPGAARALDKLLKKFDYTLANSANKMRQYVMFKLFELSENEDPKIVLKAIEMLGKVSEVGLFTTRVEVAASDKSTKELEKELSSLMSSYSIGAEFTSIDAEYEDISDEELKGEVDEEEEEYEEEDVDDDAIDE